MTAPAPKADPIPASASRWLILAAVWAIYLIFGMVMASMAPLVTVISDELALGPTVMGMILGAWPLLYIFAALPAGAVLDRLGSGIGLLLACLLMGISALLRANAEGAFAMGFAVAVLGLGGPLISIGAPKLIAALFTGPARGTAMGIYITGPYLGGLLAIGLTSSVLLPLAGGDWRKVMLFHGALSLLITLGWLVITLSPGPKRLLALMPRSNSGGYRGVGELLAVKEVRLIIAMALIIFATNQTLNNWLPTLLEAGGLSPAAAGYWSAIPPLSGVIGALLIPRFAAKGRHLLVMLLLSGAQLGSTCLILCEPGIFLLTGLVLQGLARGAMMTVALLMLFEVPSLPSERIGIAGGLFFSIAQIGGAFGPMLFGLGLDLTGGFVWPVYGLTACALAMFFLIWPLRKRQN